MVKIGGKAYILIGAAVFLVSLFVSWKRLMIFGVIGIIMFFVGLVKAGGERKESTQKQAQVQQHQHKAPVAHQKQQHYRQQMQQAQQRPQPIQPQQRQPTQQRFCTQCGGILRQGDRFCSGCGRRLF